MVEIQKKKKEKVKLSLSSYDMLKTYCNIDNLWFYIKTNIIRAPLEAAVSLYLAEILIILTDIFTVEVLTIGKIILIILIPIFIGTILCLFYLSWVSKKILHCILGIIVKYENEDFTDIELYQYIDNTFLKGIFYSHIWGVLHYLAISLLFACLIAYTNLISYDYIDSDKKLLFIFVIVSFGTVFGALWNFYGYCSDSRIDWSKIFIPLTNFQISKNKEIRNKKYKAYKISIAMQISIMILVMTILIFVAFNLNGDIINVSEEEGDLLTTLISYSSVAALFLVVLKIYAVQTYNLFYRMESNRKGGDIIFPNIFDLTEKKEN